MSWPQIKKSSFWSIAFSYSTQQQWTISQSDCDVWWKGFLSQLTMTSAVVGRRRSSTVLPKAKLAPQKGPGYCLVVCCHLIHYSFLNPGETVISEKYAQQFDEMHRKLQCLQLALVNRKGPVLHDNAWLHVVQPTLQKWMSWTMKFCLILHIHLTSRQPTPSLSISTTFCRENTSTTSRRQKILFKSLSNPKAWIFTL